jgi:outer membrane protein assembly factor BamB
LLIAILCAALSLGGTQPGAATAQGGRAATVASGDYPLFDHDAMRSGIVARAGALTAATVGGLKRQWTAKLDDVADSSPIELTGITVGGKRLDVIYLTGKSGRAYALDARTGRRIWTFDATRGETLHDYQITNASPAADPSRTWIYAASPDGTVHKLSAAGGREAPGWPVRVTLIAQYEKISSALNLVGHTLLVTTSGYIGDFGHYDGHLVAIDTTSRATRVFNTLCSDKPALLVQNPGPSNYCGDIQNGVWARGGAVVDQMPGSPTAGQAFIVTGNGPYNGSTDWGDSVLRLALTTTGIALRDAYTPTNQADLNSSDEDLGSTAPIMLPRQPGAHPWLALQGGKDDTLRLFDRANMSGRGGPGHLGGELLSIPFPQGGGTMFTMGIAWQDGGATWIYLANGSGLVALHLSIQGGAPRLQQVWRSADPATSPLLAGGALYAASGGYLRAYDPRTGRLLWRSSQIGEVHWESPMAANGQVIMPDESGEVTAFGLS